VGLVRQKSQAPEGRQRTIAPNNFALSLLPELVMSGAIHPRFHRGLLSSVAPRLKNASAIFRTHFSSDSSGFNSIHSGSSWRRNHVSCRLANGRALCYSPCMTETLTIRLPKSLARQFRAKTRAAKTNPTAILRRAATDYVQKNQPARDAAVEHIRRFAGTWDGYCSGEELLRRTRP
jgi:hypothetical protein